MKNKILFLSLLFIICIKHASYGQFTYYSQGSGIFSSTSDAIWDTDPAGTNNAPPAAGHEAAGNNQYIVQDGHSITVDTDLSTGLIVVGSGSSGTLTIGNSAISRNIVINGKLTIQSGATLNVANFDVSATPHTVVLNGDVTNNGIMQFWRDADSYADVTMQGGFSTSISGSQNNANSNRFHDLTFQGDQARSVSSKIAVEGNFTVTGTGTNVAFSTTSNLRGDFTVGAGNTLESSSTMIFDGTSPQNINVNNSSFLNLYLDNGGSIANAKTITGNLSVSNQLLLYSDAWITSTEAGHNHQIGGIRGDNADPTANNFSGGTITLTGRGVNTLSAGTGAVNSTLFLGDDIIIIDGPVGIEDGDEVRINNNITVQSGYLLVNGNGTSPEGRITTASAAGTHSITYNSGAILYIRGTDNFPRAFSSVFQSGSEVWFDRSFAQTIPLRDDAGADYVYPELNISGAGFTKTVSGTGNDLNVLGDINIGNGVTLNMSTKNMTLGGSLLNSSQDLVLTSMGTLTLNGSDNDQIIQPAISVSSLVVNKPDLTTNRLVDFRNDFTTSGGIQASNPNGNSNALVDLFLRDNQLIGDANGDNVTLNANVRIRTSRSTIFYTGLNANFLAGSYVLFENSTVDTQPIPSTTYGHLQFTGRNKSLLGDITVLNNVNALNANAELNDAASTITVNGDWVNAVMAGTAGPAVFFTGAGNQQITGTNFNDVTFGGSGTKTLARNSTQIYGDVAINDGVIVDNQDKLLLVGGNWTENNGQLTQEITGGVEFNGGITQTVTAQPNSFFGNVSISSGTNLVLGSDLSVHDFDTGNNENSGLNITGRKLTIGGDFYFRQTTSPIVFNNFSSIELNSTENQLFINSETGTPTNYPALSFLGSSVKTITFSSNTMTVQGDLNIGSGATLDGGDETITVKGDWNNQGAFQHASTVIMDNGTQAISASSFNNLYIGDGTETGTKTLSGSITLSGSLEIRANATLNAGTGNKVISVRRDWTNNGIFVPQTSTVSFTGDDSAIRNANGILTNKAFYNLDISMLPDNSLSLTTNGILGNVITVQNDFTLQSGIFRLNSLNNATAAIDLQVGGDFLNTGGEIQMNRTGTNPSSTITLNNAGSESLGIQTNSSKLRTLVINAPGATYALQDDLVIEDGNFSFTLTDGTVDLNGNTLQTANNATSASLVQNGGTITVDEGSTLAVGGGTFSPNYSKTAGTLSVVGTSTSPATMAAPSGFNFSMLQSGGTFTANNYLISSTKDNGLEFTGGTLAGANFSNGSFNSGVGNAYVTLGYNFGVITAPSVSFNQGPTHNISATAGVTDKVNNYIDITIDGGTLSGASFEQDTPDGGATDGAIRWTIPIGHYWTGATSNDWHVGSNWSTGTVPTINDIVYIDGTTSPVRTTVQLNATDAICAQLSIQGTGMALEMNSTGNLEVAGNVTIQTGNTFTAANTVTVRGAWASSTGTFTAGTSTVSFNNSTTNSYSIDAADDFNNVELAATNTASFSIGGTATFNNLSILGGNLLAGNNQIFVNGNWVVNGGTFESGTSTVNFSNASNAVTQSISGGTFYNLDIEGASTKQVTGNFAVANSVTIANTTNNTFNLLTNTIFVGNSWTYGGSNATFNPNTGTVIFNGDGSGRQEITSNGSSFHKITFQGTKTKRLVDPVSITGNLSIIDVGIVEVMDNVTGTGANSFTMTTGRLDIYSNTFPSNFGSYSLTGGLVIYLASTNQDIAALNYNRLQIQGNNAAPPTNNLLGNITVKDDLIFRLQQNFNANSHTIRLGDQLDVTTEPTLNWGTSRLIHTGNRWNMDPDITGFHSLTLEGTDVKFMNSNLSLTGDLLIRSGVTLYSRDYTLTNATGAGTTMTMEQDATYTSLTSNGGNVTTGNKAFATGFGTYSLNENSITELRGSSSQTIYTNGGTLNYGALRVYTAGDATLDGNLSVDGDFAMNNTAILKDGGFNMTFSGANVDIRKYTPSVNTIVATFDRAGNQLIQDQENAAPKSLDLPTLILAGSGVKTFIPSSTIDDIIVTGDMTIGSGTTFSPEKDFRFTGATLTNNGTISDVIRNDDFVFGGSIAQTVDPGANNFLYRVTFSNTAGTSLINNGLTIGEGEFSVFTGATADFGNGITHNIASVTFTLNGTWVTSLANLNFNRSNNQNIPPITANNVQLLGGGIKVMTGAWNVNDLTIGNGVGLNVFDSFGEYDLTVRGNWLNDGGSFNRTDGTTVFFESDDAVAKSITTGGSLFENTSFNQSLTNSRVYTIVDEMNVEEDLIVGNGATLDLNGSVLTIGNNDADDPASEIFSIQNGATVEIDAGSSLLIDTEDTNGGANPALISVASGGTLNIVGSTTSAAKINRTGTGRYGISIPSGASIAAQYYQIDHLNSNGLVVSSGATLDATNNFSNGSFGEMNTSSGVTSTYLQLDANTGDIAIDNVTFGFNGTPVAGTNINVSRIASATGIITFTNSGGGLGRSGYTYENDPADTNGDPSAGLPDSSDGKLNWGALNQTSWIGSISTDWSTAGNWDNGVPTAAVEAVIGAGSPFDPVIDGADGTVSVGTLLLTDGTLVLNGGSIIVEEDANLGTVGATLRVLDATSVISVKGDWAVGNLNFDPGAGTVVFENALGTSTIDPNGRKFHNLTFQGSGSYKLRGDFNIENDLLINANAVVEPINNNYTIQVSGDLTRATTATFNTSITGVVILNGTTQTVTNMSFRNVDVAGGTATFVGTNTIADLTTIRAGATLLGDAGSAIAMKGNISIEPTGLFNDGGATHTFGGTRWRAGTNSYAGTGKIIFNRAGNQFINQYVDKNGNPTAGAAEFNNLELVGSVSTYLENSVNLTGNLSILNSGRTLFASTYQIANTSGTGTFLLADGATIRVTGASNFPSGFSTYDMAATSFTQYYGNVAQTILGRASATQPLISYGNLFLDNANTKTLGGDIEVKGQLFFAESTLDVSANNYRLTVGGTWRQTQTPETGTFVARNGTVTFNGATTQSIDFNAGATPVFNNLVVNKPSGITLTTNSVDFTVQGNLNVQGGIFNTNGLDISLQGDVNATGTGQITNGANGTYILNATGGNPIIRMNGSSIAGNMHINANGITYEMQDDLIVLNNFTLNTGSTLDVMGNTLTLGNAGSDAAVISGRLNVSTATNPGGTLKIGNTTQFSVRAGGVIYLVGTSSAEASVTRNGTGRYNFRVDGTSINPAVIHALYYRFDYMDKSGILIGSNGQIDATNNFSNGIFANGASDGIFLRIENTQDFSSTGNGPIQFVEFATNPGGSASNVAKINASTGAIDFQDYSGDFAGEVYDNDPNNLITWIPPTLRNWVGAVSTDWYNANNWSPAAVPTSTSDVVIPLGPTNMPEIGNNAASAQARSILIEAGARLTINTDGSGGDVDPDLIVQRDVNLSSSSTLEMAGTDDVIEVIGAWNEDVGSNFIAGTGLVRMTSAEGTRSLASQNGFYDLEINLTAGSIGLTQNLVVANNFSLTAGNFSQETYNLQVGGDLTIAATATYDGGTGSLNLYPNDASNIITTNGIRLNNVSLGDPTTPVSSTYTLGSPLTLSGDLYVNQDITLDLNGNGLKVGLDDGSQDLLEVSGTINIDNGETLNMSGDGIIDILNGGVFNLVGATGNRATVTNNGTGHYNFEVESGGTLNANIYQFNFLDGGLNLKAGSNVSTTLDGATPIGLVDGVFLNGIGSQYILMNNAIDPNTEYRNIVFNAGPTNNVTRTSGTNHITFTDAEGDLGTAEFENDDTPAIDESLGLIRWLYNFELFVWNGAVDTDWTNSNNWDGPTGEYPGQDDTNDRVDIPDVSGASGNFPILSGETLTIGNLITRANSELTINTSTLSLPKDGGIGGSGGNVFSSGTISIPDASAISLEGSWINAGLFNPGTSTITLTPLEEASFTGGNSFYNLIINATSAATTFNTSGTIDVNNNLTITSGILAITDATHNLVVGGDLTVNATNAAIQAGDGTIICDGAAQNIDLGGSAANNISFAGTGTKSLSNALTIDGNIAISLGVTLNGNGQDIILRGDWLNLGLFDGTTTPNTVSFLGTAQQFVDGTGISNFENLTINNTGTALLDIVLRQDISVNGVLSLTAGIIDADNNSEVLSLTENGTVTGASSSSYVSGPVRKSFSAGANTFVYPTGVNNVFARYGVEFEAGSTASTYTVQYFFESAPNAGIRDTDGSPNLEVVSGIEYWDLSRDAGADGTTEPFVTLYWEDKDRSDFTELDNLVVSHFELGEWVDKGNNGASGVAPTSGSIRSTSKFAMNGPTSFGSGDYVSNPLPVQLTNFQARPNQEDNSVLVSWETASEQNSDYFAVERSTNGVDFETVGTVKAVGNSDAANYYQFVDQEPIMGMGYYRLKQVDTDNGSYYSVIRVVEMAQPILPMKIWLSPNPSRGGNQLTISTQGLATGNAIGVKLMTLDGKVILEENTVLESNNAVISKLPMLSTGIYLMQVTTPKGVLQKKLLIK